MLGRLRRSKFYKGGRQSVSCQFHFGRSQMYEEKTGDIGIAPNITIASEPAHM